MSSQRIIENLNVSAQSGLTIGGTGVLTTVTATSTAPRTVTIPDASLTVVGVDTTQTLTNKTITDVTNNVAANSLKTSGASVDVAASSPPTTGYALLATSATTATWQQIPYQPTENTVSTSNATPTTLTAVPTADDTLFYVTSRVIGAGPNSAAYDIRGAFKRGTGAASLVQVGTTDVLYEKNDAGYLVSFTANTTSGDIEVTVTGLAATNINWKGSSVILSVVAAI